MTKYNSRMVSRICSLIREDSYTIGEICRMVGINKDTYYDWMKHKPDFSDSIKKAEDERMYMFVSEAKKSLLKKIKGYDVEETKTVYVDSGDGTKKPMIKEKSISKKHIQPDTAAIIFTLTNGDPARWKNRQYTDFNDNTTSSRFDSMTDDELKEFIYGKGKGGSDSESGSAGSAETPDGCG